MVIVCRGRLTAFPGFCSPSLIPSISLHWTCRAKNIKRPKRIMSKNIYIKNKPKRMKRTHNPRSDHRSRHSFWCPFWPASTLESLYPKPEHFNRICVGFLTARSVSLNTRPVWQTPSARQPVECLINLNGETINGRVLSLYHNSASEAVKQDY